MPLRRKMENKTLVLRCYKLKDFFEAKNELGLSSSDT